jgi:hypothetical protein
MKFVAIIHRTIKKGKTFNDYRKAWFHTHGFGMPIKMHTVINALNPREIITIAMSDELDDKTFLKKYSKALNIDIKERSTNPLDDVIEKTIVRHFGVVAAEDDFSPESLLNYQPASIKGKKTNLYSLEKVRVKVVELLKNAFKKRDALKRKAKKKA